MPKKAIAPPYKRPDKVDKEHLLGGGLRVVTSFSVPPNLKSYLRAISMEDGEPSLSEYMVQMLIFACITREAERAVDKKRR